MGLFTKKRHVPVKAESTQAKSKTERYHKKRQQLNKTISFSLYWLIAIVIICALINTLWFEEATLTKSVIVGAGMNWLSFALFAKIAFRYSGYKARQQIVFQFYVGQIVKWLLTLSGFAIIFIVIRPINAFAVFIGYLGMQIGQSLILWRS